MNSVSILALYTRMVLLPGAACVAKELTTKTSGPSTRMAISAVMSPAYGACALMTMTHE
jgi:hypothetical protein